MKEPKLRFYLDNKPDKDGKHQIFIDISIGYSEIDPTKKVKNFRSDRKNYKPIKISALRRIKPEYFGQYIQKGERKVFVFHENTFNKYSRNDRSIKTRLEQIKSAVNFVVNNFYHLEVSPTNKEFKEALEIKLGRKRKEIIKEKTVLDFLYEKIKNDRRDRELNKKDALSENHIKTYVSLSRMFENYHLATNTQVLFSDFNSIEFYWNFFKVVDAIYRGEIEVHNPNQPKKQRKDPTGYGVKSINKYIKLLHRILSLGRKAGENVTLDTSDSSLFLKNPPAEKEVYLDEREIKLAIENTVNQSEMSNAREYLIMASLMGLRIEDMENHIFYSEIRNQIDGKLGEFKASRDRQNRMANAEKIGDFDVLRLIFINEYGMNADKVNSMSQDELRQQRIQFDHIEQQNQAVIIAEIRELAEQYKKRAKELGEIRPDLAQQELDKLDAIKYKCAAMGLDFEKIFDNTIQKGHADFQSVTNKYERSDTENTLNNEFNKVAPTGDNGKTLFADNDVVVTQGAPSLFN